ncbi:MAG: glycoside hydrolase family 31 protein, partial [bacterium]
MVKLDGNKVIVNNIEILFINEDIINISDGINTSFKQPKNILKDIKLSVKEDKNVVYISSEKFILKVTDKVDIYDIKSNPLCVNYLEEVKGKSIIEDKLAELEGHKVDNDIMDVNHMIKIKTSKESLFYGLGDKTGFFNKRGYEYVNHNTDDPAPQVDSFKSLYKSIPFFIVKEKTHSYGIFFDNSYKSYYDFCYSSDEYYSFGATKGSKDYYFISGDLKEIVSNYTLITGRYPMPQLWTLGNHQSRWGYKSKEDIYEVVKRYKENNIPLSVVHLDIDYMDNYKVFTTSNERFKDIEKMIKELRAQGIRIVCIIDPGVKVEKDYHVYEEGIKNKYFATLNNEVYENVVWPGDSVFPSFISSSVREWWGDLSKSLIDIGVEGIWTDMNEPASFRGPLPDNVEFLGDDGIHLHDEVHNLYGHYMAEATYNGLVKHTNKRPFVITRASFSGTQKYSTFWTGDNHSIWAHLQMAIPQQVNMGLSGMSFVGTDIGGFSSDCTKELMIRWVQVGIFSPLCRNHSNNGSRYQEPYQFDQEAISIYRDMMNLRYRLLPYFYDLFKEHERTGLPVIRPLVLHYDDDVNTYNINDQFMIGENMIVCPIVNQGEVNRKIYLPKGVWYDYFTKERVSDGYSIYNIPLDKVGVFVKEGAIIPEYETTNLDSIDELTLNCFGDAKYIHYQDNNTDFKYKDKEYNLYSFEVNSGKLNTTM